MPALQTIVIDRIDPERLQAISTYRRRQHLNYPHRPVHARTSARHRSRRTGTVVRIILLGIVTVIALGAIGFVLLGFAIIDQARKDEAAPADAIVVLGAAQWAGRPSNTFRARLDHAHELYNTGYADLIVLTGGSAPGDIYTEAEAGANYLRVNGVPDHALVAVGVGTNSIESLVAAADELHARERRSVILVSDPFHMFRVKRMASDLGLDPLASPTTTSPIRPGSPLEQRYVLREMLAFVNYLFFDS
jgi:uncharacterized SAM-binding protein YcdF (DUF218 family)